MSKNIQKMSVITKGKIINLSELANKPQHLLCICFIFMMEYVLQSSNLHNVMETDTTAAKMWYLICDNLPSVFRSSIFCQHKLKWVSGSGSISVHHVPVTYARLLINCNHQSKVLDSCSRCDPNRGALSILSPFLNTVWTYWKWLLSPQHSDSFHISHDSHWR